MSGNKKNNGVHEVGTTEITAAYKGDTPGQTVDEYLKLAAAKNVEKKKERSKNFSQVFDNPLKGFPYNEDFTVRDVNEEVEAFMEGMDFWKVTVTKSINKLKKGRSVIVKARNSSEALKKGAKNMGDPQANMSGYMVAVKDTKFPTNTSATQGKRMGESDEIDESSEAWVLVQNRKIIKKFKRKPSNSAFTSSDNQTLMTVSKAAKMGIKESLDEEKKDSPKEFEKKVVHTMMIMKKYPANKNKSDAVLRKGAIKYLTQKPRGASDDWDEGFEESTNEAKQAIVWKVKPPKGQKNIHPDSKWPGMKPGDIQKMNESAELDEAADKKLVKKAVETALKMGGNMTGAVKKIEKMMKGLSKDKEVAAALQLANESIVVDDAMLDEAIQMNSLLEDKAKYKAFFDKALKKFGVDSPADLKGDKKKEFFDWVDANYEAENEED